MWITTPEFVAAISNAGGLGILGLGDLQEQGRVRRSHRSRAGADGQALCGEHQPVPCTGPCGQQGIRRGPGRQGREDRRDLRALGARGSVRTIQGSRDDLDPQVRGGSIRPEGPGNGCGHRYGGGLRERGSHGQAGHRNARARSPGGRSRRSPGDRRRRRVGRSRGAGRARAGRRGGDHRHPDPGHERGPDT